LCFLGVCKWLAGWLAGEPPRVVFFRFSDLHETSLTCGVFISTVKMWGQGHLCVCLKIFQVQKIDGTSQQRTNKPKFKKKKEKEKKRIF